MKLYIPKDRTKCPTFKNNTNAKYIRFFVQGSTAYDILDGNKNRIDSCYECLTPEDCTHVEGYQQGDILVDENGDKVKVLGVCGEVYFMSSWADFGCAGGDFTIEELNKYGYKLFTEEKPDDKTEEAIALLKKAGYSIIKNK